MNARRPPALPPNLRERVLAEAMRTAAPTRAEQRSRALLVTGAGVLVTAGLFLLTGGLVRGARPMELIALTVGAGLIAAVTMTRLSLGGTSMLGRPRGVLMVASGAVAVGLAGVALAGAASWPSGAAEHVLTRIDVGCGALTVLQGAPLLLLLLLPRRRTDPVQPAVTGAALGMTAGTWAVVLAYLRCPHPAAEHCVAAHVLPVLVLAAVGAIVGRTLLRVR